MRLLGGLHIADVNEVYFHDAFLKGGFASKKEATEWAEELTKQFVVLPFDKP